MKTYEELKMEERKEIATLFSIWLHPYTHEVINHVMEQANEIINNEISMKLLKELKEREEKENHDFSRNIEQMFYHFDVLKEYDPHNNPLTHSDSYRNVLYDMYIQSIR